MTVINLFDKKEVTEATEPTEATVSVKERMMEAVESLTEEMAIVDFITVVVNSEGEMFLRSTDMTRKDAFWIMSLASDFVKGT